MKYIKLVLLTVVIASAAGYIISHLMWMTEIKNKFRTEQPSGVQDKVEVKGEINRRQVEKKEKAGPVAEEGAAVVQENRTQINQAERPPQESRKPDDTTAAPASGLPGSVAAPKSEKGAGKWYEKDTGLGKKAQQEKPVSGESRIEMSNDRTMSVTINNKANPAARKNIPQPQQMTGPDSRVIAVTPYPTSTVP